MNFRHLDKFNNLLSYCNRTTSNNIEQHRTTSNNIEQHRTRVWDQFPSKHTKPNFLANFLCKCFSQLSVICQRFVLKINNLKLHFIFLDSWCCFSFVIWLLRGHFSAVNGRTIIIWLPHGHLSAVNEGTIVIWLPCGQLSAVNEETIVIWLPHGQLSVVNEGTIVI